MLRKIRIAVAILFFILITFFFLDFAGLLSNHFHVLAHLQFVPALLSLSFGILVFLVLLTWLFGRVYCSTICPMGVFQDVVSRISKRVNRKKRYTYRKPKTILRWSVVGCCVITFLFGLTFVLTLLEPYSAYGRMVTGVFKPVYLAANNLLAWVFYRFDNYHFYYMEVAIQGMLAFVVGLLTFLVVAYLAYRYGRLYCNTICPVGTLLGALSKYSLFKVRLDKEKCTRCGLCVMKCKASCIDLDKQTIDGSRCVSCYNCLEGCKFGALKYAAEKQNQREERKEVQPDQGKRMFLTTALLMAVAIPESMAGKRFRRGLGRKKVYRRKTAISPPGSKSAEHLLKHCTACHLCVSKCPSHILKPAFMEYGLGGIMQPVMNFEKGFCNFDCTVCSEICPNGAILPLTKKEKHLTQVGKVVFIPHNCIVVTEETNCGACSEHCPTQAVTMKPYKNGLTVPKVNPDICVGCGGCEFICPVRPFRAIYVEGSSVHEQAKPFQEAEKKEVDLGGFGF